MTHLSVSEWGRVPVGESGFTRHQADLLLREARTHPAGGAEGTSILVDHHRHLTVGQYVGVLAAKGCSLEILPKVDPIAPDEDAPTVRKRFIHMLDVAFGLDLSVGVSTEMARQGETLLDILIRLFAEKLIAEVRRGVPRQYRALQDDLSALRGRLDVVRQLTKHAARPDRLACRFDALENDTPLMRIMKACVVMLSRLTRRVETQRMISELRLMMADILQTSPRSLPWDQVRIDRSNLRWRSLLELATLLLRRKWQTAHRNAGADEGFTLLFSMNDLFESYIAAQLRRAVRGTGLKVVEQGGLKYCLGDWRQDEVCQANVFQTRPDIIVRDRFGDPSAIIDTKWKKLSNDPLDPKHGIVQADVYQMMAYARIYRCAKLILLFPAVPGHGSALRCEFGIADGKESLRAIAIDVASGASAATGLLSVVNGIC